LIPRRRVVRAVGTTQRQDRGRVDIGNTGPTEDAAMRRVPGRSHPTTRTPQRSWRSGARGRGVNHL